jgi:hypothetical protein
MLVKTNYLSRLTQAHRAKERKGLMIHDKSLRATAYVEVLLQNALEGFGEKLDLLKKHSKGTHDLHEIAEQFRSILTNIDWGQDRECMKTKILI